MAFIQIIFVVATASLVLGQRPFFAGTRPIGFPELETTKPPGDLGNRFGDGTTQRLPIEALGDRDLVDRLSKLPIDKQPFWFINWQAIEANRQKPQTYPLRPNPFAESPQSNTGLGNTGTNGNSDLGNRSGDSNNQGISNGSSATPSLSSTPVITKPNFESTLKPSVDSSKHTSGSNNAPLY